MRFAIRPGGARRCLLTRPLFTVGGALALAMAVLAGPVQATPAGAGVPVATAASTLPLPGAVAPAAAGAAALDAAAKLHRLVDEAWEWRLEQFPEWATTIGDHRFDDRLTDGSPAAVAARRTYHRAELAALRALDATLLQGEDRITFAVLQFDADLAVRMDDLLMAAARSPETPFSASDSPMALNQMAGPQFSLPQLLRATPFATEQDYRHYLARLAALPSRLQQLQGQLEAGRAAGWMPPRAALARLPGQFDRLCNADVPTHPLYAPFQAMPATLAPAVAAELRAAAARALTDGVVPAMRALQHYLATTWVPAAPTALGASALPDGAAFYALSLQQYNTTRMTPADIHALGLGEVARLDAAMQGVMREAGFAGTLAEFRAFLRTDPQFQFRSADEALAAYRDIAKRVDPQLPGLFAELPRLPYGVRAMSPEEGNNAPHYIRGAIDGTRAGYFEANVNNLAAWPRWTSDSLFLHEAVPGHHLQIARAQELQALPKLRRAYTNSGYVEGWGLYAESLGGLLGLYADPYTRFGRLTLEAHRACRLVVDTGLHSQGWSREQAIQYLIDHALLDRAFAEAEVDRYLVWPGQATAYKVGELRILAARERARQALGARFDLRQFHNAVIDHGALPLTVLDQVVDAWVLAQSGTPAAP